VFRLTVAAGAVTATLRFSGAKRLALSLGATQRVAGRSPLQLRASPAAGTIVLRVSGDARTKVTFVLRVNYAK
jgi:hypothetical protein